jgi:hypothetical protein
MANNSQPTNRKFDRQHGATLVLPGQVPEARPAPLTDEQLEAHKRVAALGANEGSTLLLENPRTGEQWEFHAEYMMPLHSREVVLKDPSTGHLTKYWILKNGSAEVQEPHYREQGQY